MALVGIIANPTSGKDIRRWVGQAQIVGNREKVNIVKRVMIGLQSVGVRECGKSALYLTGQELADKVYMILCFVTLRRSFPFNASGNLGAGRGNGNRFTRAGSSGNSIIFRKTFFY